MADKVIDGSLDVTGEISQNGHSIAPQISVTWAELKALRDGGTLIPGQQYRITDYQCTTTQENTSSAGHQFDIIVTADSANKLNEVARACLHEGDTYFASNKLEAWQLWYCIDNDTNRFAWADAMNGKGVIYRMIDEFGNDIPYDFKNILFTKTNTYTNAYTFSYTESAVIKDASISGLGKNCCGNMMKEYINVYGQWLNFNVFYSTSTSFNCHDNTFGGRCISNTFGNDCSSNIFGNFCSYNTFGGSCKYNTFGNDCSSNAFGNNCQYNTFGSSCHDNTFGNDCTYNTFGDNCPYNTFDAYCSFNIFGNSCAYNTFGNNCLSNTFNNSCYYNTFGTSSTIAYCRNNIIDNGCHHLYINSTDTSASSSNYLQNVHVHSGVHGTSSERKTLTVPDRNLDYETNYEMAGSTTVTL